jgi:hypothetical protein
VSVKVTGWPNVDGFGDDPIVVETGARPTTWVSVAALGVKLSFPLYVARIVCGPTLSVEMRLDVAVPVVVSTGTGVPSEFASAVKETVPPSGGGVTVAVKFTG